MTKARRSATLLLALFWLVPGALLEGQERQPLDHDVYEIWATISSRAISADGRWTLHTLSYEQADSELVIRAVDSDREHRYSRAAGAGFTADGRRAVFRLPPSREAMQEHRDSGRPNHEQPRDVLVVLELETGEETRIEHVRTHSLPSDAPEWLLYHLHPGDPAETEAEHGQNGRAQNGALVLHSLATGEMQRFPAVTSFTLANDASLLLVQDQRVDREGQRGLRAITPATGEVVTILESEGTVRGLTLDADRGQAAFLYEAAGVGEEEETDDGGAHEILLWERGATEARVVVHEAVPGFRTGWEVSQFGGLSFSDSGERLYFGTAPKPVEHTPDPAWSHDLDSEVNVDVWHWQDSQLMTVQKNRVNQARRENFRAVLLVDEGRVVQLADETMSSISVGRGGDGDFAVGVDGRAYELMGSWESPNFRDIYLVDVHTGERELLREASQGTGSLSPEDRFLTWY